MDTPAIALARRLKAARVLSGKKARELARELGWTEEKLYRLERGVQVPDALELAAIAALTDQPIDYFYVGTTSSDGGAILSDVARPVNDGAAA